MSKSTLQKAKVTRPFYLLSIVAVLVFIIETGVMLYIPQNTLRHSILDATFLTVLLLPILYYFVYKPMLHFIAERNAAESELRELNKQLEKKVADRTAELEETNKMLQVECSRIVEITEEKTKTVLDNIDVGVTIINPQMQIVSVNSQIRAWHPNVDTSIKQICYETLPVPPRMEPCPNCPVVKTFEDGKNHENFVEVNVGGNNRYLRSISSPVKDKDGKVISALEIVEDYTERKLSQEALQESEQKAQIIAEAAKDAIIIIDDEGLINFWNPAAQNIFGYSAEESIGKNVRLLLPPKPCHEKFLQELKIHEDNNLEQLSKTIELSAVRCNGQVFPVELSISSFRNKGKLHTVGIVRDITERKKEQEQILNRNRGLEERYSSLIKQSSEGIFVLEPYTLTIQEVNNRFLQMLGYTEEEIVGRTYPEIAAADMQQIEANRRKILDEEQTLVFERKLKHKVGFLLEVEVSLSVVKLEDSKILLVNVRDITDRKNQEKALRDSYDQLKRTLDETVNALIAVTEKRDPYTAGHLHRVAELASTIAKEMGLSDDEIEGISIAGKLHDIGKIYIPADILNKPGKLSEIEFAIIKTHSQVSYDILKQIPFKYPVGDIVIQHHERLNGTGYPYKLTADNIHVGAKILAVADVIEAMASHRPYRPTLGIDSALTEITRNKGTLYDPTVVDAAINLFNNKFNDMQKIING